MQDDEVNIPTNEEKIDKWLRIIVFCDFLSRCLTLSTFCSKERPNEKMK